MRYFIEVCYNGMAYAGFQVQQNADTVQGRVEAALKTYYREALILTGSSRTDAQVHALQNFFHVDTGIPLSQADVYHLNAILPSELAICSIREVEKEAHARFDAVSRKYAYHIYTAKDPFMFHRGWHYPYPLDLDLLDSAAGVVAQQRWFGNYAKRHSQVKTFECRILESTWERVGHTYIYHVRANRFLRGMVRALVASMLRVGRKSWSLEQFEDSFSRESQVKADFAAPGWGLFLEEVAYPEKIFKKN
jgi:tRNA pseudouridine38-40 synthase